ncbi:hypothetical protein SAMN05428988_6309 [Chitinophaga sp. YR573]|uniref:hypothetical protein n=1 Tax=Chitinophaga sp. YR573 TaxID=1881040 RepID=UPI0008C4C807|nr:hypothetical protein SAMN05428988_6309 [Chitinophaga sp. YR573]
MVQLKDNTGDRNTSYSNTFPFLNGTIEKLPSAAQYVIYKRFQFLYGTIAGVGGGAVHDMGKGFNSSMVQLKDERSY